MRSARLGFGFEPHVVATQAHVLSMRLEPEAEGHHVAPHGESARPAQAGRTRFTLGAIVRGHRAALEAAHPLTPMQKRVLTDIAQCRTAALGGHLDVCLCCGYERPAYNSCRNRHCPTCQALAAETWIDKRSERLLDLGHFHVVFTLPAQLRPLAKYAPEAVYEALFEGVRCSLLELGHERFDATLGATLVLHTWRRDLRFHPHVHAIVTAGGLRRDDQRFHHRPRYLFHVKKVLGPVFRGKVLHALSRAYAGGAFAGFDAFQDPAAFGGLVAKLSELSWNVYAKAPFEKSKHVLKYLGRYTHRVGIANSRLLDVTDEHVVFRTKGGGTETTTPVEFLYRFVQHVLPPGFHKIRHIGLYASPARLALARELLPAPVPSTPPSRPSWEQRLAELTGRDVRQCPVCDELLHRVPLPAQARGPPRRNGRPNGSPIAPRSSGLRRRVARQRAHALAPCHRTPSSLPLRTRSAPSAHAQPVRGASQGASRPPFGTCRRAKNA